MDLLNLPVYLMTRVSREWQGKEGQFSLETLDISFNSNVRVVLLRGEAKKRKMKEKRDKSEKVGTRKRERERERERENEAKKHKRSHDCDDYEGTRPRVRRFNTSEEIGDKIAGPYSVCHRTMADRRLSDDSTEECVKEAAWKKSNGIANCQRTQYLTGLEKQASKLEGKGDERSQERIERRALKARERYYAFSLFLS